MTQLTHKKALSLLVTGAGGLVGAIALSTKLHNDFASGITFGVAIGLLALSVLILKRGQAKPQPQKY